MTFREAITTCLKHKYATFEGRAMRSEYWYFMLFQASVYTVLVALLVLTAGLDNLLNGDFARAITGIVWLPIGLTVLFFLGVFIPSIAVTIRRLHDRNMSGWWYLAFFVLGFVPVVEYVASLAMIIVCAMKGTDGDNKYGHDPLKPLTNADVFS